MNNPRPDAFDQVLSVLAHPYRRELLIALIGHNPQADDDLDPLELLGGNEDPDVTEVELRHVHLPKLEDEGYIQWNTDTGEISKGPNWDEIAPLLELMYTHRDELPDGWLSVRSTKE